ncbi:thyroid receptor-interacting protein 11-like [Cloeon dipterum]|uniref:thyroid receptor-interacting protein 11-like n=1 Tax=Cloeon dipterum TaxID=197152 RepID=UPI00321FBE86
MDISWFGQSLSNITGQISSLTREVVEEVVEGHSRATNEPALPAELDESILEDLNAQLLEKETKILELQSRVQELELAAQPKDKEKTHQRTLSGKYEIPSVDFINPVVQPAVSSSPFLTEEVTHNPFAEVLKKEEAAAAVAVAVATKILHRDQQTQTRDVCSADASGLRRSTSLGGDLDTPRQRPEAAPCNDEILHFLSYLEAEISKLRAQSDCNLSSEEVDTKFLKTLKNKITEWKEKSMAIGTSELQKAPLKEEKPEQEQEKYDAERSTSSQSTQCALLPEKKPVSSHQLSQTESTVTFSEQSSQCEPAVEEEKQKPAVQNESSQCEPLPTASEATQVEQPALNSVGCDNLAQDAHYLSSIGQQGKSPEEEEAERNAQAEQREAYAAQVLSLQRENAGMAEKMKSQSIKNELMQEELKRLRQHMIEVEEEYTQEALIRANELQELQARYASLEDKHSEAVTSLNQRRDVSEKQLEQFRQTHHAALAQRDAALSKLKDMEVEIKKQTMSTQNFQAVIEQLQLDRESALDCRTHQLQEEVKKCTNTIQVLEKESQTLQEQLADAKSSLKAAARLTTQIDAKQIQVESLQNEVSQLNQQLQDAQEKIKESLKVNAGQVDKNLIKNLLISFLMTPANMKMEALKIVATFLDFSDDDRVKLGMQKGPKKAGPQESLTEAFVKFLESESKVKQGGPIHQVLKEQFKDVKMSTENTNPTMASSSSSSMLKDVLKPSDH